MKKLISIIMAGLLAASMTLSLGSCGTTDNGDAQKKAEMEALAAKTEYTVGVCQLMKHDSLDQATKGFNDALTEKITAAGKKVNIEEKIAGESNLCATVINTFTAKNADLIMANATPALLAAATATSKTPVLGTSVTDYNDTFSGNIPANVSGTSDAVPFDEQAKMMIDTLGLKKGDKVGVIYCTNESNSLVQYNAVKELFEAEGIEVSAYTFSETTELQAVVNTAASQSKAIYVPSDNTVAQNDALVGTICSEKNIPVFTSYGGAICYASLAIDYYKLGYETGVMAADVLLGNKHVSDIEIATLTPTVVYNDELCEKLGIEVPKN